MGRGAVLAALVLMGGMPGTGWAQENGAAEDTAPPAQTENGEAGQGREIVIPGDLEEDLLPVELALQIALAAAELDGKTADLQEVARVALESAETNRQKAYVHLRIGEMYFQRGDYQPAIDALETALPLADGDRSKESLYFRILRGLLIVYDRAGRIAEARSHILTYREIMTAGVDPWERPAGSEDVIHKPSGIRLPQRLGAFTRDKLFVYDDTGRDAGAGYRTGDAPLPELSVYLVAEFEETAKDHFDGALRLILDRFAGAQVLSSGPFRAETAKGAMEGFAARVDVPATGYALGLGSDLYVFVVKGTLIKFRVSFQAKEREGAEAAMAEVFKTFDWP